MSAARTVTLIRGDGIGPEVADAVVSILEAARAPLSFEEVVVGREEGWEMLIVVPAAVVGALILGGTLYASMPRRGEIFEEIK